jgi:hypothetical protein
VFAFAKDETLQTLIRENGLEGALPPARQDIAELALISTNVGGNKSDRFTALAATHTANVQADGSVQVSLDLQKVFTLPPDFEARIAPLLAGKDKKTRDYLRFVLGDGTNKDFLRVFLPLGTTVRKVDGLAKEDWAIYEELGRTVLGMHVQTQVGETKKLHIEYELPLHLDFVSAATYRFRFIKQPGVISQQLKHVLTVAPGLNIVGADTRTVETDLSGPTDSGTAAVITRS